MYPSTSYIYYLSLHDALPISLFAAITTTTSCGAVNTMHDSLMPLSGFVTLGLMQLGEVIFESCIDPRVTNPLSGINESDRKSTRLNSSHQIISYAVFCLKKKK